MDSFSRRSTSTSRASSMDLRIRQRVEAHQRCNCSSSILNSASSNAKHYEDDLRSGWVFVEEEEAQKGGSPVSRDGTPPVYFCNNKVVKPKQKWWRWNLIWTLVFVIFLVPAPAWVIPLDCKLGTYFVLVVNGWNAVVMLYVAIMCIQTMCRIEHNQKTEIGGWAARYPQTPLAAKLRHIVVMRGYKEPLDLMFTTIDSLADQTVVKQLIVVIALEAGSPAHYDDAMRERYHGVFADLVVTRHPREWDPREKPGACSNANYAWRFIAQKLLDEGDFDPKAYLCTSLDTDTIFPDDYMEYCGLQFLQHKDRHGVIWQAPLFYNLQLDERPWFVRCTGIMRTAFMSAFLIGANLNPMSIFSFSLDLLIRGDFINPQHTMDDVVHVLTCMKAQQKNVPVIEVPLIVISGPTSGSTLCDEWYEWARQVRRWCIGTLAVFHLIVAKLFRCRFEFFSGLWYAMSFTHYYGFVLCSMLLTSLCGTIAIEVWRSVSPGEFGHCGEDNSGLSWSLVMMFNLGSLGVSYLSFAIMFYMDRRAVALIGIEENMPWWRNVLHWLLMWPTLLMYNIVQVFCSVEGSLRGEKVVSHNASKKDNLGGVAGHDGGQSLLLRPLLKNDSLVKL